MSDGSRRPGATVGTVLQEDIRRHVASKLEAITMETTGLSQVDAKDKMTVGEVIRMISYTTTPADLLSSSINYSVDVKSMDESVREYNIAVSIPSKHVDVKSLLDHVRVIHPAIRNMYLSISDTQSAKFPLVVTATVACGTNIVTTDMVYVFGTRNVTPTLVAIDSAIRRAGGGGGDMDAMAVDSGIKKDPDTSAPPPKRRKREDDDD